MLDDQKGSAIGYNREMYYTYNREKKRYISSMHSSTKWDAFSLCGYFVEHFVRWAKGYEFITNIKIWMNKWNDILIFLSVWNDTQL